MINFKKFEEFQKFNYIINFSIMEIRRFYEMRNLGNFEY